MKTEPIIRFAKITDLPSIVDIYNQAIRTKCTTGDVEEFNVEDRIEWFKKYDKNAYPLYILWKLQVKFLDIVHYHLIGKEEKQWQRLQK